MALSNLHYKKLLRLRWRKYYSPTNICSASTSSSTISRKSAATDCSSIISSGSSSFQNNNNFVGDGYYESKMKLLEQERSYDDRLRFGVDLMKTAVHSEYRVSAAVLKMVLDNVFDKAESLSREDALFLMRCCGRLTPGMPVEKKMQYLHIIWDSFPRFDLQHDVEAFGRLQRILLQNRRLFCAEGLLRQVRAAGYQPDDYIYLGSIIRCCVDDAPDFDRINFYASQVKSNDSNIRRKLKTTLFSALAEAKQEDRMKQMLEETASSNNAPEERYMTLSGYYFSLAVVQARRADAAGVFETINEARKYNASFSDYQLLYLAGWLASSGCQDSILRLLSYLPKTRRWILLTLVFVLKLIAEGHYVTALTVLQRTAASAASCAQLRGESSTTPLPETSTSYTPTAANLYHFILDLFQLELPPAQIMAFCRRLADCGYREDVFDLVRVAALDMHRQDVSRMLDSVGDGGNNWPSSPSAASTPPRPTTTITNRDNGPNESRDDMDHPNHHFKVITTKQRVFLPALRIRSALGQTQAVLNLLNTLNAVSGRGIQMSLLATSIVPYYFYSSCTDDTSPVALGLQLNDLFALFAPFSSRCTLFNAFLAYFLMQGDRRKVRQLLSRDRRMVLLGNSSHLAKSLCCYYLETNDLDLVVQILTRIENTPSSVGYDQKTILQNCLKNLHSQVSRRIGGNVSELTAFSGALSKAGFDMKFVEQAEDI